MSKSEKIQVGRYAKLAKIELSKRDEKMLADQMQKILEYFRLLDAVDTSSVDPISQPSTAMNVTRDDVSRKRSSGDAILSLAPSRKGRYIKAPKIV